MQKLMDQTTGSFNKEGAEKYIRDFFKQDVLSSPKYRKDTTNA